jgi:hypothetical protein
MGPIRHIMDHGVTIGKIVDTNPYLASELGLQEKSFTSLAWNFQ